jgi:hypothetical protein
MSWAQGVNETASDPLQGNVTNSNTSPVTPSPSQAPSPKDEKLEASTYIKSVSAVVKPGDNGSATVLCEKGDLFVSGGYKLQLLNAQDAINALIYANYPTGEPNNLVDQFGTSRPTLIEGWETGLLNNGKNDIKVTAQVLCANIQ